jgi:hypothetical protein
MEAEVLSLVQAELFLKLRADGFKTARVSKSDVNNTWLTVEVGIKDVNLIGGTLDFISRRTMGMEYVDIMRISGFYLIDQFQSGVWSLEEPITKISDYRR